MKQVKIASLVLVGYVLTMQQVIAGQPVLICPDCAKVPEIDGTGAIIAIGLVAGAYVLLRAAGRLVGAWAGGVASHADATTRRWIGLALMPQAGVALGMALVVQRRNPEIGIVVLPVVIAATVFFEIVGPVLTRVALRRVGEVPDGGIPNP